MLKWRSAIFIDVLNSCPFISRREMTLSALVRMMRMSRMVG